MMQDWNDWNTRPIEDALRASIAELEKRYDEMTNSKIRGEL